MGTFRGTTNNISSVVNNCFDYPDHGRNVLGTVRLHTRLQTSFQIHHQAAYSIKTSLVSAEFGLDRIHVGGEVSHEFLDYSVMFFKTLQCFQEASIFGILAFSLPAALD